jgi:hypothetical protein
VSRNLLIQIGVAAAVAAFGTPSVAEAQQGRVVARGERGVATVTAGPEGGAVVRARAYARTPDDVSRRRVGAVRSPYGGAGARGADAQWRDDGSFARRGGFIARGPRGGAAYSSGSAERDPNGAWTAERNTAATGRQGASYRGQSSYDPATGLTRITTCVTRNGEVVACPRAPQ